MYLDALCRDSAMVRHHANLQAHGVGDDVMHWNRLPQDNKKLYGRERFLIVPLFYYLLVVSS